MNIKNIEKYNKELYKILENKIKEKQIKRIELCEKIGIVSSTLSEQLNRLKNGDAIMTSTLFRIMLALDIDPSELLK